MGGLVMVSAGITLANIVAGRRPGDRAVAAPGFAINIGFGTFVEAAYPFMFSDKLVFAGAILASTVSGALAGVLGVRGTAYVPSIVAPGLSNNPLGFLVVMVAGLAVAFAVTFVANRIARSRGAV
jgi:phosphotransferase system  glucose/maltose/N-acetylglucosamine-specific IIC component